MGFCLKCKLDPCQCDSWPDAPSDSTFPFINLSNEQKTLEECLSESKISLIDRIIEKGNQKPPELLEDIDNCNDQKEEKQETPSQLSFDTSSKFGWIKGRFAWGIRVDFRPCSVGGMTDVFAINIVDIEEVGWRGCTNGQGWYKSIIRYRT